MSVCSAISRLISFATPVESTITPPFGLREQFENQCSAGPLVRLSDAASRLVAIRTHHGFISPSLWSLPPDDVLDNDKGSNAQQYPTKEPLNGTGFHPARHRVRAKLAADQYHDHTSDPDAPLRPSCCR